MHKPFSLLLVTVILTTTIIMPVNAEPDQTQYAYVATFNTVTTSDWSLTNITGLGTILATDYQVLDGEAGVYVTPHDSYATIYIGKAAFDRTRVEVEFRVVFMNPDPVMELKIQKGFIGLTQITVDAWKDGQEYPVKKITHDYNIWDIVTNKRDFELDLTRFNAYRIPVETSELPLESVKQVFAFYYPWYGSVDGPSNAWVHWDNVTETSIGSSTNYPLLGPYDSKDESIIEAHISMADMVGIDGFVSSWWGPGTISDEVLGSLLNIAGEIDFKISVYYESRRDMNGQLDLDQIADDLTYILQRYSSRPSFLKIEGTPVIFIYNSEDRGLTPGFWDTIRTKVEESFGEFVFIGDFRSDSFLDVFDGVHIYNELDLENAKKTTARISDSKHYLSSTGFDDLLIRIQKDDGLVIDRKITIGTVIPGYDDTKIREPGQVLDREEDTYGEYWDMMHEYPLDWVFITSWNEWHEGTEIEPSLEHGFTALLETKRQIDKFKNGASEPLESEARLDTIIEMGNPAIHVQLNNTGPTPVYNLRIDVKPDGSEQVETVRRPIIENMDEALIIIEVDNWDEKHEFYTVNVSYYSPSGKHYTETYPHLPVYQPTNTTQEKPVPEEPKEYPPLPTKPGIELELRNFTYEVNGGTLTVTVEIDVLSNPAEIEYCSLDVLLDGKIVYGQAWSSLPELSLASLGVTSPVTIGYDITIPVTPGNHTVSLKSYARNSDQIQGHYKSPIKEFEVESVEPEMLSLDIIEFSVEELGNNLIISATAEFHSNPSLLEYSSITLFVDDLIIGGQSWTDIPGLYIAGKPALSDSGVMTFTKTISKPVEPYIIWVESYARNVAGLEKTVRLVPPV